MTMRQIMSGSDWSSICLVHHVDSGPLSTLNYRLKSELNFVIIGISDERGAIYSKKELKLYEALPESVKL